MMNEKVDIEIFKRRLSVEIEGLTPMQISALATVVNDKMIEVAGQHKNIADSSKLAILTALNLAAELSKIQDAQSTALRVLEHDADHITLMLKTALAAAGRGE